MVYIIDLRKRTLRHKPENSRVGLFARTIYSQRILVHHLVAASNKLFGEEAFHDADFEIDAVHEDAAGIAHGPIGAEDKPILAKGSPQKFKRRHIPGGVGDGLELRQPRGIAGYRYGPQRV